MEKGRGKWWEKCIFGVVWLGGEIGGLEILRAHQKPIAPNLGRKWEREGVDGKTP